MSRGDADRLANLIGQAADLFRAGQYQEAATRAEQIREAVRRQFGGNHPYYASLLNILAVSHKHLTHYAEAEPLYREALEIFRTTMGERSEQFSMCLNNLAELVLARGEAAAALPLYEQSLAIRRATVGEASEQFATALNNLGCCYTELGDFDRAEEMHRQALAIDRTAVGEGHPNYATDLSKVADLLVRRGEYVAARPLYERALEIRRHALGPRHPEFAHSLKSVASLHVLLRDFAAALPLYQHALRIWQERGGPGHPQALEASRCMAWVYDQLGDRARAASLYEELLRLVERTHGPDHPGVARCLADLADMHRRWRDNATAERLYERALGIYRKQAGGGGDMATRMMLDLAELYQWAGNHAAAEPLCRQGLTVLGRSGYRLRRLAWSYAALGRTAEALDLLQEAAGLGDQELAHISAIASDRQRLEYLKAVAEEVHIFLSLVFRHLPESADAVRAALDLVLRRKGLATEILAAQRAAALQDRPNLRPLLTRLVALQERLARTQIEGPGAVGDEAHGRLVRQWTRETERLEQELAARAPEHFPGRGLPRAACGEVAARLPVGSALVEYVRCAEFDFRAAVKPEPTVPTARYLAFVLPAQPVGSEPVRVHLFDLGEAEPTDRQVADFRAQVSDPGIGDAVEVGEALRARLFDPLANALEGRTRLFLAPDGPLALLPFEALPAGTGGHLLDEFAISYLTSGRDVLRFGALGAGTATDPVVLADPDFDLGAPRLPVAEESRGRGECSSAPAHRRGILSRLWGGGRPTPPRQPRPTEAPTPPSPPAGECSSDLARAGLSFRSLPVTRVEGERVAALLSVWPWLGAEALEGRLKAARSPRILHAATHGFCLGDQQPDLYAAFRNPRTAGPAQRLAMMENPLLRSGLALAGANWMAQGFYPPADAEDGLLTAADVAGMDLHATDLVVLSACVTAQGQIQVGEGVLGLRRSFVVAGARALVMTLWEVPDLATAILMERFYENLTDPRRLPPDEALRVAQRHVRDLTVADLRPYWLAPEMIARLAAGNPKTRDSLEALSRRPDGDHPYRQVRYWGALICQGDPVCREGRP
jgi:CHAT domain-containing protein/tetratricopeptide (TPR) repeat protein